MSKVIFAINQINKHLLSPYCVQIDVLGPGIPKLKDLSSRLFPFFFVLCNVNLKQYITSNTDNCFNGKEKQMWPNDILLN